MAIANFIPEVWSAALLKALRDRLTYAQAGVINRNYEGDIARAGDTVHITSFNDPAVRTYTRNTNITWDQLSSTQQTLVVDQEKYFAFTVDDVDRRQALPGFVEEATVGASYNLAAEADSHVAGLMAAGVAAGNKLGAAGITSPEDAYDLLVELRTVLTRSNTPDDGRFVVIPPELYGVLLKDDRFIRADASGTTAGLRNGYVGRAAGFDVIESNRVPEDDSGEDGTVYTVLAGHSIATTYAEQILNTEALRLEQQFGDGVRGLHVYGGKVIRPANLASADVTV
ncbi:MAG TPA: P22 phage major capsid protein family protein [Jiangellaceae bacterium]|nr:P22 phage major capsid protein family protein [Jiangellaceae bacterium]